jgi:hypothetical protein
MKFFNLLPYYFSWHYFGAIKNLMIIWGNYIWFTWNYFSIKILFLSFFRPYKRIDDRNFFKLQKNQNPTKTFSMRLFGVLLRLAVLVAGAITMLLILVGGFLLFVFWFFLPLILIIVFVLAVASFLR